tara:strand:+ start:2218 stop:2721 length:504 start_codon:yes stop_codon:yes gene_type:complete
MQVYKNFLEKNDFQDLIAFFKSNQVPWYFNHVVDKEHLDVNATQNFQFTHIMYNDHRVRSDFFDLLTPIFIKINPLSIIRVKANLVTKTSKIVEHGMHVDYVNPNTKITTGIFYLNTNNGYTKFQNGKKVKSVANQFVEFDSALKHTGTTCTDEERRMVINFNYIKK